MFSHHNDNAMRPPAVVTTMGKLKQQYTEPDWSPAPQQQQWHQHQHQQSRGQAESRDQYWGGNARAGNSIVADERDTRAPTNNYHYSATTGRGHTMSPRQYQQQQLSSREAASYLAAIKAANDSMSSDGRGSVTALRGLWKVFDAAVSELGTELNDSLSNKAIFEANVSQEALIRQGRKVTEFEKKSDALSRKRHYEAELKSTLLRLKGSFADVILGTKKELQSSIDKSFAVQATDIEKSFDTRLKDMSMEIEKSYTRKAIESEKSFALLLDERDNLFAQKRADMEQSFAKKKVDMEQSFAKKKADMEQSFAKDMAEMESSFSKTMENDRDAIARVYNELNQAEQNIDMLQTQLGESEQAAHVARAQLNQERESYQQALVGVERSRDDAVTKLSSTLETLQNTCASAHSLEVQLHDTEGKLRDMEEKQVAANQQWGLENQRANAIQGQLNELVKNKNALINVQKEMEKHLGLERERGDLLQQQLDAESQSKEEVVMSVQAQEKERRGELDRAYQGNLRLKSELDELQSELKNLSQENSHLKSELDELQSELKNLSQENSHLINEGGQLKGGLERASQDNMNLHDHLKRANEVGSTLKANLNALQEKFEEQAGALHASKEEFSGALHASREEYSQLTAEFHACKDRLNKTAEMNTLLEAKVERLEAKVQDQVMDLEAARMSEADVERSLTESLQRGDELESKCRQTHNRVETLELKLRQTVMETHDRAETLELKLRQTVMEQQAITEKLTNECRQKGEKSAALEEANQELSTLRMSIGEHESDRDMLECKLEKVEMEKAGVQKKLHQVVEEYAVDRDKIANALKGFDEEISNAEEKLKSVMEINSQLTSEKERLEQALECKLSELTELEKEKIKADDLEVKIKDLTETQEKEANERATEEETLKKKMEDFAGEKKIWEDEIAKVREECKTKVSKYESDIGVYEEAIKMLQKQVDILQELADSECEACTEKAKTEETRDAEQEEVRLEFVSRVNTQKLEHDSIMMGKNAEIASLREKCFRRDESMKKLEKLCVNARKDLATLRDQKTFLEGSLERSIRYIKELKHLQAAVDGGSGAIEVVAARSPRSGKRSIRFNDDVLDDICNPFIDSAPDLDVPEQLDALLTSIETQLGVGQCGSLQNGSQIGQHGGAVYESTLGTKSW